MKVTATVNVTVQRDDGTATSVAHTTPLEVSPGLPEAGCVANAIDFATIEVTRRFRVNPDA